MLCHFLLHGTLTMTLHFTLTVEKLQLTWCTIKIMINQGNQF